MNILNPSFVYTNSASTDVARHWRDYGAKKKANYNQNIQDREDRHWATFTAMLPDLINEFGAENLHTAIVEMDREIKEDPNLLEEQLDVRSRRIS
jgi:hypothetical protein